jgi:CheY-like chemotaxis protein
MKIVYAEDDPLVRQSIATLLAGQGVDVLEAGDGEEAIWLCRVFHPDVVLLDLGMPQMDGFETARRLRETPAGRMLRIVALTAYGDVEHQRMAKQAGFDEFLGKPISMNTIVNALRLCNQDSSSRCAR